MEALTSHLATNAAVDAAGAPAADMTTATTGQTALARTSDNTAWEFDPSADTTPVYKTVKCTGAPLPIVAGPPTVGNVCVYDTNSDFILRAASKDTLGLAAQSLALSAVTSPLGGVGGQDISTVLTLLAAHGEFADISTIDFTKEMWFTVFAPNKAAFDAVNADVVNFLTWNKQYAQVVLKQHILPRVATPVYSELLVDADVVETVNTGVNLTVAVPAAPALPTFTPTDGTAAGTGSAATVVAGAIDVYTQNAVVHVVDQVLVVPSQVTAIDGLIAVANYTAPLDATAQSTLIDLVGKASAAIAAALVSTDHLTLIAPTDAAFEKLTDEQVAFLVDEDNVAKLDEVLLAHVLTTPHFATGTSDINAPTDGMYSFTDSNGATIKCNATMCGDATISNQRYTKYGVVYDSDTVIVPDNIFPEPKPATPTGAASSVGASALLTVGAAALAYLF